MASLLIDKLDCSSFHFTGICGSGMSALAQYLRWNGVDVSGSDRLCDKSGGQDSVRRRLEDAGCRIFAQDGAGINTSTGAVVVSSAIEPSNPDIAAAKSLGIPVLHRSDVLAAIVKSKTTVAVAGTSGKSTVTAIIFHILHHAGKNPSLITGANLHSLVETGLAGNAFAGTSPLLVIEADESDGSLVKYHPEISLFLNISKDHKNVEETLAMFKTLADQSGFVICNGDDPGLASVCAGQRFGATESSDYRAVLSSDAETAFALIKDRTFSTGFPGMHMAMNILASMCVCSRLGVKDEIMAEALKTYKGIERRFDRIPTKSGVTVIDDYAHNPDKIRAALITAQKLSPRITALFQPHGFGPTRFMFEELVAAFAETIRPADTLILLPIYYAGGTVQRDISSGDIARRLAKSKARILAPEERKAAIEIVAQCVEKGDVVILMGARDPSLPEFARKIASALDMP